jgi:LacI family transcriptional regulator
MKRRVRIQDIAAEVGVSPQTVSRVMNQKPDVAPETRARILEAIQRTGYAPSALARGLVSNKTFSLGLVTEDISDPFYAQVIAGAELEARKLGYFLLICSSEHDSEDESRYLKLLSSRQVEGILLFSYPWSKGELVYIDKLLENGLPLVSIGYRLKDPRISFVDFDNVDGGYQAANCLIGSGRKKIGTITGPHTSESAGFRVEGYKKALSEAGIPYDPTMVVEGNWSYASGYEKIWELINMHPDMDALFAQNDRMAIGAMRAFSEMGKKMPEQLSIVGYDDIPAAAYTYPPLTTIRQPAHTFGELATRLLIELIDNPAKPPQYISIKPELIERISCN